MSIVIPGQHVHAPEGVSDDLESRDSAAAPAAVSNASAARRAASARAERAQVQRQAATGGEANAAEATDIAAAGVQDGGARLPHLDTVQRAFGAHDLSGVTAHTGAEAQTANRALGADAYATGNKVAFAGTPSLHTVAHEAAHVVQQREGVSLKGNLGQSGDRYEQQADAVADKVVAGESVETMLGPPKDAGATPAVQRVVQRHETATPEEGVAERAKTNDVTLESIETLEDQTANQGKAPWAQKQSGVAIKGGGSMAKDPQLEKWALQFEMSFGKGAMGNGSVKAAVKSMCDRVIDIIIAAYNTSKQKDEEALSKLSPKLRGEVGKACGLDDNGKFSGVAGAVSKDKVLDHMGGDNIRTQMTAIFNFGRPFQSMLQKMAKAGAATKFIESLGGDTAVLESRIQDLNENPNARLTPNATEGAVGGQAATRGEFDNKDAQQSIRKGSDVGLTDDEAAFMDIDKDDGRLKWEEGARRWRINENNEWVQSIRELSMPLKAGPSGTTDRLMQTQAILGVTTPSMMRAAALAYLLPINAHSMVEIMVAAAQHGVAHPPGLKMYESVDPYGSLQTYSPHPDFWKAVTAE